MADISVTLILDNKEYIGGLKSAESATKGFENAAKTAGRTVGQSFESLRQPLQRVTDQFSAFKTMLLGAAFGAFANSALNMAAAIVDVSKATGIGIDRIVELQAALAEAGGQAENAARLVTDFYQSINEAAQGGAKAQEAFAKVGISLNDLRTLSEEALLDKAIAGMKQLGTGAEATSVGLQLFGRAFRGVATGELADNLDKLRGKFAEQVAGIQAADAAQQQLENTVRNLQLAFMQAFGPALELIGALDTDTSKLATVMRALAAVVLATFAVSVIQSLMKFIALMRELQIVTKGQVILQTALAALSGPKGWIMAAGAVAAVGGAIYGLNKLLESTGQEQKKTTEEIKNSGGAAREVTDAFAQQIRSVRAIGDTYQRNNQLALDRVGLETRLIGLSDTQAERIRAVNEVQQRGQEQIAQLQRQRVEAAARGESRVVAAIDAEIGRIQQLTNEQVKNMERSVTAKQAAAAAERMQQAAIRNTIEVENIRNQILGIQLTESQKLAQDRMTNARAYQDMSQAEIAALEAQAAARDKAAAGARVELTNLETTRKLLELQTNLLGRQYTEMEKLEELKKSPAFKNKTEEEIRALEDQARAIDEVTARLRQQRQIRDVGREQEDFGQRIRDRMRLDTAQGETSRRVIEQEIELNARLRDSLREIDDRYGDVSQASAEVQARRQAEIETARKVYADYLQNSRSFIEQDQKTRESFAFGWEDAIRQYVEAAGNGADQARRYFDTFARGAEDALMKFVQTGKFSFRDLANSLIQEFARNEIRNLFAGLFGSKNGGGFGSSLIGSLLGGLFGGGKAVGGPVMPGKAYVVGERGPELLVPGASGTIIPNHALGGQPQVSQNYVTYNINATDAASFRNMLARDPEFLFSVTEKGRLSLPGSRR